MESFLGFERGVVKLIGKSAGRAFVFASYTLAFALQLRKKHGKILPYLTYL
jgi:hypothetical protein